MATTPDADIVTLLDSAVGSLTAGTNLFRGKRRPVGPYIPGESVFCLSTGGPGPEAYADGTSIEEFHSAVDVSVRSDKDDFDGGQTLARAVRTAINHATIAGYIDVRIGTSDPLYIGEEDSGFHLWTINVEMWHEE
jgi:hypothetical protein